MNVSILAILCVMRPPPQGGIHRGEVKTQTNSNSAMITLKLVDPLIDRFVIYLKLKLTTYLQRGITVDIL